MGSLGRLLNELNELLTKLSEEAARGVPLLVEGNSDIEALMALGVEGCFVAVKASGKPMPDVALDVRELADEAIILTDFDREGRERALELACELERLGVKANLTYWKNLMALVSSFTKDVEGLPSFVETLMRKLGPRHG